MSWHQPHFDAHQFVPRYARAVSAESGLAWEDFGRMHVDYSRAVQRERRLESPLWAMGNALREVIVRYLERRLFLPPSEAPMAERLDAIQQRAENIAAAKLARLAGYLREYVQLQTKPDGPEKVQRLRGLERQIKTLDGEVALMKRGLAATVVSIVYLFHRCAWDGKQVAAHLGLRQQAVRQVLYRLNRAATTPARIRRTRTQQRQDAARARQLGITLKELRRRQKISLNRRGKCRGNKFSSRPRSPEVKAAISKRLIGNRNAVGHKGYNGRARHFAQPPTRSSNDAQIFDRQDISAIIRLHRRRTSDRDLAFIRSGCSGLQWRDELSHPKNAFGES